MSRQLVESILSKNMLEANDIFEAKLKDIREKKMYEMKRMYQAEAFGGLTPAEIEARKKAGYKRASEVLGDPRAKKPGEKRLNPQAKIIKKKIAEESLDEASAESIAKMTKSIKTARALKKDPERAAQFRAAMKLRHLGLVPKLTPKPKDDSKYSDSLTGRTHEKLDKWIASGDRARSGGRNLDVAKSVGKTAAGAVGTLAKELGNISGF